MYTLWDVLNNCFNWIGSYIYIIYGTSWLEIFRAKKMSMMSICRGASTVCAVWLRPTFLIKMFKPATWTIVWMILLKQFCSLILCFSFRAFPEWMLCFAIKYGRSPWKSANPLIPPQVSNDHASLRCTRPKSFLPINLEEFCNILNTNFPSVVLSITIYTSLNMCAHFRIFYRKGCAICRDLAQLYSIHFNCNNHIWQQFIVWMNDFFSDYRSVVLLYCQIYLYISICIGLNIWGSLYTMAFSHNKL